MKNFEATTNDLPMYLFHQGTNYRAYEFLGSHFGKYKGCDGVFFRVWAPKAINVSVVGDFNNWNNTINPMKKLSAQGVWECFISGLKEYDNYKYSITSASGVKLKADPYAFHAETPIGTASKIYELSGYNWGDNEYYANKEKINIYESPVNIYEVNLGSWKRNSDGTYLSYQSMAESLVEYVKEMGYTHVEFMPISEFPFDGSWGYQVTGYFAVTSRFGTPHDFMHLVDEFHKAGIGVILDWVPAHFPKDEFGLYEFDGSSLYEDFRETRKEHKAWGTRIFDYGRNEVQSFLISSAMFYFDKYHIDGIRVDAVASMLYLDYDRKEGEWIPNELGTNINLEAVAFLRKLNSAILSTYPKGLMIAEESTAFPLVTMPPNIGGLGFNFKWNMGWMNDVLSYCRTDAFFRRYGHNKLTFSMVYAFSENFILPISHDEVVHGKCSLINKMPGEYEEKFNGVKAFMGYMMSHPGKKLMFMGQEFGQFKEWNYKEGLEFFLLDYPKHAELQKFFKDINIFYRENESFYSIENSWDGFEWIIADDAINNVIAYERKGKGGQRILVVVNFSGKAQKGYRIGAEAGKYEVIFNSDYVKYGGKTLEKKHIYTAKKGLQNNKNNYITINIPELSFIYLKIENNKKAQKTTQRATKKSKKQDNC